MYPKLSTSSRFVPTCCNVHVLPYYEIIGEFMYIIVFHAHIISVIKRLDIIATFALSMRFLEAFN